MNKIVIVAGVEDLGRIDRFLAGKTDFSREYIKKLISDFAITVNGKTVKSSYAVKCGDRIRVDVPEAAGLGLEPLECDLAVLYEDGDLLVIDKAAGMVVHPGQGDCHAHDSLVNAILHHCGGELSGIGGVRRPGIVHRLDKDTSGVMVVAKNNKAHEALSLQFKDRKVEKIYLALIAGEIRHKRGRIVAPIGRDTRNRKRMIVTAEKSGKEAESHYTLVRQFVDFALLNIGIHSGRTHQIRVHLAAIGYPVVGDKVYGVSGINKKLEEHCGLKRQFLHARELEFTHPSTHKRMRFESPLPEDLQQVIDCLEKGLL